MESMDEKTKIERLSHHIKEILKILGEDTERQGLVKTPERSAKALLHITKGYRENIDEVVGDAFFPTESKGMVIVKNIEFYSMCEHHLLPFFGNISIGYLPDGKIIGLSKLVRVVEMFARRLQVQENITEQICQSLTALFPNKGFIVRSEADHLCMKMRGVEKQESVTVSFATSGLFNTDPTLRQTFLDSLR